MQICQDYTYAIFYVILIIWKLLIDYLIDNRMTATKTQPAVPRFCSFTWFTVTDSHDDVHNEVILFWSNTVTLSHHEL